MGFTKLQQEVIAALELEYDKKVKKTLKERSLRNSSGTKWNGTIYVTATANIDKISKYVTSTVHQSRIRLALEDLVESGKVKPTLEGYTLNARN